MDNKKKFFIALGIILIVYFSVMGFNLSHDTDSDYMKDSNHKYSKENVTDMMKKGNSSLQPFFNISSSIKSFFLFLLPEVDLFDVSEVTINSSVCEIITVNNKSKLLITKNSACKLVINEVDKSSRRLSFVYKRVKNIESSRGVNKLKNNKLLLANSKVVRPQLKIDKSKLIRPNKIPANSGNKIVHPLSLTFIKFDGEDVNKEKKVIKENEKVEYMIPQKGAELILECSVCQDYDLLITQNDNQ